MRYLVKTLNADGGIGVLALVANDAADAERQAVARGGAVISVARDSYVSFGRGSRATRFPLPLFSQELLALLESGIAVVEAIETLAEKEHRPGVRSVLLQIVAGLRDGRPLSATLEAAPEVFPPLYVAAIRASERTSSLAEALRRYLAYAVQLESLRSKLVSATIYPAILIGIGGLVILFLLGYVVPRFSSIYETVGGELPLLSKLLLQWGVLVQHYWPALLGLVAAAVAGMVLGGGRALSRWVIQTLWRIPAIGERMEVFQLARLYRTLGMLLRGGIAIVPALEMVVGLLSPALQARLRGATKLIREGVAASLAFERESLATPVALRMLRVGERTGNMGEMMDRAATFHDEEMARWADWATRLIGPVLMLLMGVMIGGIVVLMYLPIFQLTESVR
jgi:general secretion pathway protein F